ncbi:N-acetylmuramoyl-L-alanine amidase [Neorhizobium alkalisoli]|uniref:N-acetylmuramoyl-L-alanine amidase n=1 Tax=Neorhizobium alkalisoli TaxID=528178 RepID=A0A561R1T3_9HYPH|nr:N-acetylmuramoyl-L-alanine amidase [Neorhizobium alkalisoli]TWF56577.1 N-acetylmuramoyl-L-alanine amidase [Neorhizobium alkalisoli]
MAAVLMGQGARAAQPILAYGARIAGDAARTRIVIDFEAKPEFSVHYVGGPERIIIDLPATAFGFPADDLSPRGLFKDIRYGTMGSASARIVLTSVKPVRLVKAEARQEENGGYRLVLDAEMTSKDDFATLLKGQDWNDGSTVEAAPNPLAADDGVFTVAIDAGHGGIDAGATALASKTPEKVITLGFAKLLADKLNKLQGVKAFLTREDDTFLSLSERVTIARQHHADLFISLHADTVPQKDIRGATVYTLSDKASDRMAENLAARENLSDQIAGVSPEAGPSEVADILLDLTRRETQAFSVSLADKVVKSFEGQVGLINNPHRQAGFQVLRAPDFPSVLLELGFLSNPDDERQLLDEAWREKVAGLISAAVDQYRGRSVANGG